MAGGQSSTIKQTNDSEWEDVTDEWQDISAQPRFALPKPKVDKPWYQDAYDSLIGMGKGAGKQIYNEASNLNDLVAPLFPFLPHEYDQKMPIPSSGPEAWGAKIPQYGTYAAPVGLEAKGASLVGKGLRAAYPAVRNAIGPTAAKFGLRGAQVGATSGIGAASGAGTAAITDEDVGTGALTGGIVPGAVTAAKPFMSRLGRMFHTGAIGNMGKALEANYLNRSRDYIEKQIIQPLLDRGEMFSSLRNLEKRMRGSANQSMRARDAIRAQKPADYSIPMNEVEDALGRARESFSGVSVAPGQTMPAGERDIAKRMFVEGKLQPDVWKASNPALAQAKDVSGEVLARQGFLPQMKGGNVLFDTLEDFKQDWASFARQHGKYQGKKMVGQIPESTVEVEAKYEAANELRKLLREKMPKEWDDFNRQYHIDTQIADLAEQRDLARMGNPTPMAETIGGEAFSKFNYGRAVARGYMKVTRSPAWQSAVAQLKERIGKRLGTGKGFKTAALMEAAASFFGEPDIKVNAVDQPGKTYDPASEDLSPLLEQSPKRMRWDPESQQFIPGQ